MAIRYLISAAMVVLLVVAAGDGGYWAVAIRVSRLRRGHFGDHLVYREKLQSHKHVRRA